MNSEYFDLLIDFYGGQNRQGPGSESSTMKALSLCDLDSTKKLKVLDMGCGTGASTICLAKELNAQIHAVDMSKVFLDSLEKKASDEGVDEKIQTHPIVFDEVDFDENSFDLLWSEGAIYNLGFEKGLNEWRKFLKPEGRIAVSEITWLTNQRPAELHEHWNQQYPEIDTADEKLKVMEKCGYEVLGQFMLGEHDWMDSFYRDSIKNIPTYLERHSESDLALKIVQEEREEQELYKRYNSYFSYGFYIAKKV